ncbi:phage tail protein [Shewanella algae]|uniref:phage tail-collar fiber domain-containing protein n=1 Tax=Shewanella algae TaxID=38313 RepID=UPI0031F49FE6
MGSVITIAGEKLFAAKAQANQQLDIDTFIFANVPGQDPTAPIDREEPLPPQAQIVHQQVVQQVGRINENVVVYSTVLDSVTGPFEFNWVGLYSSVNQTLVAINHVPTVAKTVTGPGVAGNTLNRNFGIEYSGIADLTGITVAPETWQLDFTARLSGMDELTRQLAADMNGKDWFIGEGFKVVPSTTANSFLVMPGVGYVSGLRIELEQEHIINVQTYPQFIYVDAWFAGDANSMWKPNVKLTVSAEQLEDYVDVNGANHYLYTIAIVESFETVKDLRLNKGIASTLKKTRLTATEKEIFDGNFDVGDLLYISDRENALGKIIDSAGLVIDGFGVLHAGNGKACKIETPDNIFNVRHFGAKGDWFDYSTGTINPNPTDDTAALHAVYGYMTRKDGVNGFGWRVYYPTGYYAISEEVKSPSVTNSYGDGRFNSHIVALPGFKGVMLGDKGSAAKLYLHNLAINTRDEPGVTDAIKMGYQIAFGTEGGIYELMLIGGKDNAVNNTNAINIVSNVGLFHHISITYFKRAITEGPNSTSNNYDNIIALGCKDRTFSFNTATKLTNWHIEAPVLNSIPIYIAKSGMIGGGTVSLSNDDIEDLIVIPNGAQSINVSGMQVITSLAGRYSHVLNDQRVTSKQRYWADSANKDGVFNFNDASSQPIGTAGQIRENAGNVQVNNNTDGGSVLIGTSTAGELNYFVSNADIGFDGPGTDNVKNLARPSQRYTNGYFVNTPTGTSDRKFKTGFGEIQTALKSAALEIKNNIQIWQWVHRVAVEGEAARKHIGPIAQDIYEICEKHGIDAFEYAFIGKDYIFDQDESGKNIGEPKGEIWSIKPIEVIWLVLSAL